MTKSKRSRQADHAGSDAAHSIAFTSRLETAALLVLLALIPLRTFLNETGTFEVPRLFRGLDTPSGPGPATSFTISALILLITGGVACLRIRARARWSATGAGLGAVMLLISGIISTAAAGQKHLAIIGAVDFLAMVIYCMTLRQLLTRPWHIRAALCVILSTGAVVAAKCGWQRWEEWPNTIKYFEEHRAELTNQDGPSASTRQSGMEYDYEMRLRSGAVTGFYAHPNLLASQLILLVLAGAALAFDRLKAGAGAPSVVLPAAISLILGVALVYTQSKGAVAACVIGLTLWPLFSALGRTLRGKSLSMLLLGWGVAGAMVVAIVIALNVKPDLLGRSILFRHMYWRGAVAMVKDHPLSGVGPNNFGRHFTRYKSVECPEEVDSPHSWQMQLLTEWGPLGLIGFLTLAFGVSRKLLPAIGDHPREFIDEPDATGGRSRRSSVMWACAVGAAVFGFWLIDLNDADPVFLILQMTIPAFAWFATMLLLGIERWPDPEYSDSPLANLVPILGAGLAAFLIHTSIDLALFSGGPAMTFFALVAIALAARSLSSEDTAQWNAKQESQASPMAGQTKLPGLTAAAAAAIVAVVLLARFALPSMTLERELRFARLDAKPSSWNAYTAGPAFAAYVNAQGVYKLDATAITELTEQLIPRVQNVEHSDLIINMLEEARRRDPDSALVVVHLGGAYRQRFELTRNRSDFERAISLYRNCIEDYPTSPDRRVQFANLLESFGHEFQDKTALQEAAMNLETALSLESRRIYVSLPNRMPHEIIEALKHRIGQLRRIPVQPPDGATPVAPAPMSQPAPP